MQLTDFGSSIRTEGDNDGINDKGLVTYDRKIKKDAFYFYKANWNPEPMIYISERRNTERKRATTSVKIYANQPSPVELWVNDKKISSKTKNELNIIIWENIALQDGRNSIKIKSKIKGKVLEDACEWNVTAGGK